MILTNPEQLRVKCSPVLPEEVKTLKEKLELELALSAKRGFPGVGLACPQIGTPKQMAIVRTDLHSVDLVNAEIIEKYDEYTFTGEGCLSFPKVYKDTKRFREIVVSNNLVSPHKFTATGFLAVVIQHELDHLNERLLIDF